jgi:hypothetical protein
MRQDLKRVYRIPSILYSQIQTFEFIRVSQLEWMAITLKRESQQLQH